MKHSEAHPREYYMDRNILEDLEKLVKQQGDLAATKRKKKSQGNILGYIVAINFDLTTRSFNIEFKQSHKFVIFCCCLVILLSVA